MLGSLDVREPKGTRMNRTVPRNVLLTGALVAVLGLWFGLRSSETLGAYGDCIAAHGYGADAWAACDLEVR